jgi:hypothetical protein
MVVRVCVCVKMYVVCSMSRYKMGMRECTCEHVCMYVKLSVVCFVGRQK